MKKAIVLLCSLISIPAFSMDLLEVYQLAQRNDPAWRATLNNYLADQQNEAIARAGLLPNIGASGSLSRSRSEPNNAPQVFLSTSRQLGLSLRQPIFSPERWARYQQAKSATNLNDATLRAEQQAFVLKVAEAYFKVLQAEAQLEALKSEEDAFARQHLMMSERFKAGVVARTDVTEALAQYQNALANRISAEVNITASREELTAILGQPVQQLAPLRESMQYQTPYPNQISEWEGLAQRHNPEIEVARQRYVVAQRNQDIQRAGHKPSLDLVSNAGWSRQDLSLQTFNSGGKSLSVGLELNVPIYLGGQTSLAVRQAGYQTEAARDQILATQRQATSQVRSAFLNLQADQARIKARQAAVESGDVVAQASQVGYELGVRNIVEVFLAQRSAFAAKRDYIAARYDYVINVLRLRAASGQLTANDLMEINTWLQTP
ncbi:MAG: TolC family outer membrane protein [Pseudomonadota bacterium]|nr:TolC family outer membrane protein [Pseudomonadota bacterium]